MKRGTLITCSFLIRQSFEGYCCDSDMSVFNFNILCDIFRSHEYHGGTIANCRTAAAMYKEIKSILLNLQILYVNIFLAYVSVLFLCKNCCLGSNYEARFLYDLIFLKSTYKDRFWYYSGFVLTIY